MTAGPQKCGWILGPGDSYNDAICCSEDGNDCCQIDWRVLFGGKGSLFALLLVCAVPCVRWQLKKRKLARSRSGPTSPTSVSI